MKKQILNLGKALSKAEQKVIHGGNLEEDGWCTETGQCQLDSECPDAIPFMGEAKKGYCRAVTCDGDPRKYCDVK